MRTDPLIADYPVRIRNVTIGVLITISGIFYIFPRALGESSKTDYLIVGKEAGTKEKKAKDLDIKLIDESRWLKIIKKQLVF